MQNTIGLSDLLDEIARDLDDYRKKHPSDYQIKAITLWWELERERLLVRHGDRRLRKTARRLFTYRTATWLLAGSTAMLLGSSLLRNL